MNANLTKSAPITPHDSASQSLAPNPTQQAATQQRPEKPFWYATFHDPIAAFTFLLVLSTMLLWRATIRLARDARRASIEQGDKMERSIAEAAKAAVAATDQVKISQDSAYRQLRAYISIESIKVRLVTDDIISGSIILKNAGQTPAAVKFFINHRIGELGGAMPEDAPAPYSFSQHNPFINARSEEEIDWFYPFGRTTPEATAKIARLVSGGKPTQFFMIYGRVEFEDYNRHSRVLNFAYRSHGPVRFGEPFDTIACPWGNGYEDRSKPA